MGKRLGCLLSLHLLLAGCQPAPVVQCLDALCAAPDGGADGGSDLPDAGDEGVDAGAFTEFCAALPVALCEKSVRCHEAQTVQGCLGELERQHVLKPCLPTEGEALREGRLAFDAEAAQACLAALTQGPSCTTGLSGIEDFGCAAAFSGRVPLGAPCGSDLECGAQGYCGEQGVCPGTCLARRPAGADALWPRECQAGLSPVAGKCQAPLREGETCVLAGARQRCGDGLFCDDQGDETCKARLGQGAACPNGDDCAPPLLCTSRGCQPPALLGEACTEDNPVAGPLPCAMDLRCEVSGGPMAVGSCGALRLLGQPCASTAECSAWLFCEVGGTGAQTCRPRLGLNAPCPASLENEECQQGLFCPQQPGERACRERLPRDAVCLDGSPWECQDGLTCTDGRCRPQWCEP